MLIKVKSNPSLDRIPFEVKRHIAEYLPRESLAYFSQTNHDHHQVADSPMWKVYLKSPPDECESYRELFLDPSQRKLEFVTADRIGKDFIARFKNGILCIDPETQTISLEQAKTRFRSLKEKVTQKSYIGTHEWKVQSPPQRKHNIGTYRWRPENRRFVLVEENSRFNNPYLEDSYYNKNAKEALLTEKLVIDLSHVNRKIPDGHGCLKTPLGLCCERGFLIAVQFLLAHPDIQIDTTGLNTIKGQVLWGGHERNSLIIAIENRHFESVKLILMHLGHKFSSYELDMLAEAVDYYTICDNANLKPLLTELYFKKWA